MNHFNLYTCNVIIFVVCFESVLSPEPKKNRVVNLAFCMHKGSILRLNNHGTSAPMPVVCSVFVTVAGILRGM